MSRAVTGYPLPPGNSITTQKSTRPGVGLAEHVIDRIRSGSLRTEDEGHTETYLLEFLGPDAMLADVVDPLFRPQDFCDWHSVLLRRQTAGASQVRRTATLSSGAKRGVLKRVVGRPLRRASFRGRCESGRCPESRN